jgi:SAM-dependent methyltransferase
MKLNDEKDMWENALSTGTYFDCGYNYAEDLIRRRMDKSITDLTLGAIGAKSGRQEAPFIPCFFDVEKEGKDWSMLEIGCGYGLFASHFCFFVKEYIGIDVSKYIVEKGNLALREANIPNAKLLQVDNCNLDNLQDNYFDLIFTAAVFIHTPLEVTRRYLELTYSKLKKGGRFLHHFNMCSTESGIHNCGSHTHMYTEKELDGIFSGTGLKIQGVLNNSQFSPGKWMRYVYGVK